LIQGHFVYFLRLASGYRKNACRPGKNWLIRYGFISLVAQFGRVPPLGERLFQPGRTWTPLQFRRRKTREATMEKMSKLFSDPHAPSSWPMAVCEEANSHLRICIPDKRISRLLLVLQELDKSVAGLEELQQAELSELVLAAIEGCGFTDPVEASDAIAAVLDVIEKHNSGTEYS
jgi:hypothetical protein